MISSRNDIISNEAFVWVWLPGAVAPVVTGKLVVEGDTLVFNYGKSYLARADAISLYDAELPLTPGVLPLRKGCACQGVSAMARRMLGVGVSLSINNSD